MSRPIHRPLLALAVAGVLGLAAVAAPADARERRAGANPQQPRGDFARHTEHRRTDAGHVRKDTWTGADGRSASREATVVNDRDAGLRSRDVLWTGPDGRTATRQDVARKTENGYTRDSTFTNPAGRTVTRNAAVVNDKDAGTRTREATTTLPDGRTRSLSDVVQKTESGYARDTTIVNPNGATLQRDVTATYDAATKSWTKDVAVDRTPAPEPAG